MSDTLNLTVSNHLGIIEINNPPKRNAFDLSMWHNLPKLIEELDHNHAVRLIILRGIGKSAFCSGADLSEFSTLRATAAGGKAYEQANEVAFTALARCSTPTLAAIRGYCMGAGLGLAASCDLRIAESGTEFGIPEARLGAGYPPRAMAQLVAALGVQSTMYLFATARRFKAEEAQRIGFLARVFPAEAFEQQLAEMAQSIATNAPLTIKAAKAAIHHAARLPDALDLATAQALADACYDSADYIEGLHAFLEKRPARFSGH